jgi:hypothetical protein
LIINGKTGKQCQASLVRLITDSGWRWKAGPGNPKREEKKRTKNCKKKTVNSECVYSQ